MENSKEWYKSKTILAALVTVVVGTLGMFGVGQLDGEQESIVEAIMQLVTLISGVIAIVGRVTAKSKVTGTGSGSSLMLLLVLALVLAGGCVGHQTRESTLLPVIDEMWQSLRVDALVVTDANALQAMDSAVAAGDKFNLPAGWTIAKPFVLDGIEYQLEDKRISARLALSKQETVERMDDAVTLYTLP